MGKPCMCGYPNSGLCALNLNSEVWILVLDQSTFSAAMRVRWLRNYFVPLV